ncbi:hypothetical protein Tco_1577284 [Tanacetum coccineum]
MLNLKYVESLEDEIDELESDKAEFSNMYDMLLQECVSNDIMCSYLQSSSDLDEITELQCLYLHKVRECDCLAQKLSDQTEFNRYSTNVHAKENNDNQAEFTNPFCTPVQENAESSSRNIGTSNMHTFNQPQDSEYRWTTDHPLTQVCGNPSKPVQTRQQLVTDPEMCMFALTVSIVEQKTLRTQWLDSASDRSNAGRSFISLNRLQVEGIVKQTFGKM